MRLFFTHTNMPGDSRKLGELEDGRPVHCQCYRRKSDLDERSEGPSIDITTLKFGWQENRFNDNYASCQCNAVKGENVTFTAISLWSTELTIWSTVNIRSFAGGKALYQAKTAGMPHEGLPGRSRVPYKSSNFKHRN
jgi:hypothetical protein